MTTDELDRIVDTVMERARRMTTEVDHREWEFNRDGIKAAVVLHVAVMQTLREIPASSEN